jgi:hypothetical protein
LKAAKYRAARMPLLLFVVLVGHDIGLIDLETALFGTTVGEMTQTGGLRDNCHHDWHIHGLFCPPGPEARHRNITAVVSCDWFDSLARTGRRLHCVVYHHWRAEVDLRTGAFGQFPDVHFLGDASGRTLPAVVGTPNVVMSTDPEDAMKCAPYSASRPW